MRRASRSVLCPQLELEAVGSRIYRQKAKKSASLYIELHNLTFTHVKRAFYE
jgi:hypothetical protein